MSKNRLGPPSKLNRINTTVIGHDAVAAFEDPWMVYFRLAGGVGENRSIMGSLVFIGCGEGIDVGS